VPGAGNPMAFDRYAYANNNALKYVDPTGHTVDCPLWDTACRTTTTSSPDKIAKRYGVKFTNRIGAWSIFYKFAAVHAIMLVARNLARELDGGISGALAFNKIYRGLELVWDSSRPTGGLAENTHRIVFGGLSTPTAPFGHRSQTMAFINARNNVVHELGHAFAQIWYVWNPDTRKSDYLSTGPYSNVPGELVNNEGFYPNPEHEELTWRQHPCTAGESGCGNEVFAYMFLGWTFDKWGNDALGIGSLRDELMTNQMDDWAQYAANR